jgi:peptidyl-dipeptidase A
MTTSPDRARPTSARTPTARARRAAGLGAATTLALSLGACATSHGAAKFPQTVDGAQAFTRKLDGDLRKLYVDAARTDWIKNTYITEDTELVAADAAEKVLAYTTEAIHEAARFDGLPLDADTARMLYLLKVSNPMPAPSDATKRAELAAIAAKMTSVYGKGKHCKKDAKGVETCRDIGQLTKVMATSRNYDELYDAWAGWRTISVELRDPYARFVGLVNDGAKEIGFKDAGELWRSAYDMPAPEFQAETDRLWNQVKPLYEKLHCYVRGRLAKQYGADKVKPDAPIPAHLLGNLWSQEWANVYPLVEPFPGAANIDVTQALVAQSYDAIKLVKLGESFFTSLGLDPLPDTFWKRSQFVQPKDRDVVCHASAWDVTFNNDLRIKMCIKIDEEDLITVHHELGHNYYFMKYFTRPVLFQNGANDGFHEAIGDAIALSVNPDYYAKLGIMKDVPKNEQALVNIQMKDALEKIAFLPFGLLVDKWRWGVFSGEIPPAKYNEAWWALRKTYQGIAPHAPRGEEHFDAGSKYHVPANVPYMRYFLARILQFQFHRSMCQIAGHKGALHECSIYGNKEVGKRLGDMLALGASKPWPDALEALTGQRQMDASALVDYFAPLSAWLDKELANQKCGW